MKKFLLFASLLGMGFAMNAQNTADFNTFNNGKNNSAYSTYTTTSGWTATNCAIVKIGDDLAPTLNGKTTAVGTLTSPTLTTGIGTLSFSYENTFSESNGVSVRIDIKQNGEVKKTQTLTKSSSEVAQNTAYTFTSEAFDVEGNFVIEITNLSPSNNTGNKDRVSIWNVSWTSFGEGGDTGGGNTGGDTPEQPDQPSNPGGDDNGNIVQKLDNGLGFPEGSANAPKTATQYTATDTNITYTIMGCYTNSGYIMVNGKNTEGAYISWSLDMNMSNLIMATSNGCSTNEASAVNVYAGDNLIGTYKVNVQNANVVVEIPEAYQTAGTVYKVESATKNYNQQFVSFTYVKAGNEVEIPDQPDQPEQPEGTITVAKALELIAGGYNGEATVGGIISEITEVSAQYGNATYSIKDDLTDANALLVYRGKWIDGANFTSEDQIAVGGKIVVSGTLVNYNGTYEFTTGNKVVSYSAPEGDVPTPPTPDEPTGTSVTFDFTDPASLGIEVGDATEYDLTGTTLESGVVSMLCEGEGASTSIRLFCSNKGDWTFRFYKDTQFTVSVPEEYQLTGIVFDGTNLNKDVTYSVGTYNDTNKTWTPGADEVTSVTVTKTATGNNPTVNTMTVYYDTNTGVEAIEAVDGEAVYYNLQGVRVANPERGIFVKVQNGKAVKVVK